MRVVIVEDEPRARRGLRDLILSIDPSCTIVGEAADGRTGYEIVKIMEPDVVFTDIRMPKMDGLAMISALKLLQLPKTQYVILSAYEEFDFARQAISLGVKEYLVKPVTYEEVQNSLGRLHSEKERRTYQEINLCSEKYDDAHILVRRAIGIIEKSYMTKISQEIVAKSLSVTPEYLSSIFKKNIGETFPRFVNRYRIEKAKALLLTKGVDKKEIPYMVGFSDSKYFYKVFRDIEGMTVQEFILQNEWK